MLLNVNSVFTMMQSTLPIETYVQTAKKRGYSSIGLADRNVLFGVYQFVQAANQEDVKPLIGMTVEISNQNDSQKLSDFLIYAIDYTGYLGLIEISLMKSDVNHSSQDIWNLISDYQNHLIMIIPNRRHELIQAIIQNQSSRAESLLSFYLKYISKDNLYIGLEIYPLIAFELRQIDTFCQKHRLKTIMSQFTNQLNHFDQLSFEVLQAIHENNTDLELENLSTTSYSFLMNYQDLIQMYQQAGFNETISNTEKLVEQLNVTFPEPKMLIPTFTSPSQMTSDDYLKELTFEALNNQNLDHDKRYIERLDEELHIIQSMGFSNYFLIVWDIISFCRKSKIQMGPGRGSAAGSLVSFLLQITTIDPIKHDLLFERFLNPERYTMPDIDIDIPDNQRERVIQYVEQKYGHDQVAQIMTLSNLTAKAVIRDTLRVLGFNQEQMRQWSQAIPTDQNQLMTLERAYNESHRLRELVNFSDLHRQIFKIALTLEGFPRNISTHAAAIVIFDQPLKNYIPLIERPSEPRLTQFTMYDVEALGLLKMDFLGLKNLTILDNVLSLVEQTEHITIDIDDIPFDDDKTLKLFQAGKTNGVFQFESDGIKQVLRQVKPENLEDIIAVNALYRPGPMKNIQSFVQRKHGQEPIEYEVPLLEDILKNTYGIIVYQEQVMQILVQMGGFSFGQADVLRRAMSKKLPSVMASQRERFVSGAMKNGYSESVSQKVYDYIYAFSNYGFNKAHAAAYSTLAYQLAYLKANYPLQFYQVIINSGDSINATVEDYLKEVQQLLGEPLWIDINRSGGGMTIEDGHLRLGFNFIRGIRQDMVNAIIETRDLAGDFTDINDFLLRLPDRFMKIELIQPLALVGAFESLGYNRATLVKNLPSLIKGIQYSGGNLNLFEEIEPQMTIYPEFEQTQIQEFEKEHMTVYLGPHPLDAFINKYDQNPRLKTIEEILTVEENVFVETLGLITRVRAIQTKRQQAMAFVTIEDRENEISVTVFPDAFQKYQTILEENQVVHLKGRTDLDRQKNKVIILNHIERLKITESSDDASTHPPKIIIKLNQRLNQRSLEFVNKLIEQNPGPATIIFINQNQQPLHYDIPLSIGYSHRIIQQLKHHFGQDNVDIA